MLLLWDDDAKLSPSELKETTIIFTLCNILASFLSVRRVWLFAFPPFDGTTCKINELRVGLSGWTWYTKMSQQLICYDLKSIFRIQK